VQVLRTEYADNLSRDRTFVAGPTELGEREACDLLIVHPLSGETFRIGAEAVWIQPGVGVGLALSLGDRRTALEAFIGDALEPPPQQPPEASLPPQSPDLEPTSAPDSSDEASSSKNLYDRIRELRTHERDVMARQGSLPERVALERCFQGAVWEALLGNPQLTTGEVARIAKNPGLPVSLVTVITANAAWVSKSEIQRALLANPRLAGPALERVLKSVPRSELGPISTQAGYRPQVRQAAKKLLGL
jgi:hypothetical protein